MAMNREEREQQNFVEQWRILLSADITLAALQTFYARYKYLIMSRHIASYDAIGALLADGKRKDLAAVAQRLFELMMQALSQPVTRGGDANALLHICGYLKTQLHPAEKCELLDAIESYRCGEVELEMPVAMLRAYFERFPNSYIEQQVFLQLSTRSH